nr:MAG TPA: hypothetical protein [Bacteriophage sp.]
MHCNPQCCLQKRFYTFQFRQRKNQNNHCKLYNISYFNTSYLIDDGCLS